MLAEDSLASAQPHQEGAGEQAAIVAGWIATFGHFLPLLAVLPRGAPRRDRGICLFPARPPLKY